MRGRWGEGRRGAPKPSQTRKLNNSLARARPLHTGNRFPASPPPYNPLSPGPSEDVNTVFEGRHARRLFTLSFLDFISLLSLELPAPAPLVSHSSRSGNCYQSPGLFTRQPREPQQRSLQGSPHPTGLVLPTSATIPGRQSTGWA